MRYVIVGAGLAGGNVAVGLREEGFDGEVILLGDEPGVPFGRPPLSKSYLRGEEDLTGWLVKPPDWYETNTIDLRPSSRVVRIDASGRRVILDDGEIECDAVCIATGCRARLPSLPGQDLEGVCTLRTKADCDAIRTFAHSRGAKAAIVGMSFIGAEVAASLRQLGVEVTAIFPGTGPLSSVLGDQVAARMAEIHRSNGVELITSEQVIGFEGAGRVERVETESGKKIDCTFAVVGMGVQPNVEFLEGSGIALNDGVMVDGLCRTNLETGFAVGDVAEHNHPLFGGIRVEHYNNAEKQGRYVARSMLGKSEPYDYVHSFWSDQYDHKLEYVGFTKNWDRFVVRGDRERFLGFYLMDEVIKAVVGLDRGGDPEGEPESELAACVALIRSRKRMDADRLEDEDFLLSSVGQSGGEPA